MSINNINKQLEDKNNNIIMCKSFKENKSTKLFFITEINSGLLLSGASVITDNALIKLGVTCVVSVCPELPQVPLPNCVTKHYLVNVRDSPNSELGCHFDEISNIIEQVKNEGGRTLVHCVAGVSRSATLCLAYLIKHGAMTLKEAFCHVRSKRDCIWPNNGFFIQLISYERKLKGTTTVEMVYNDGAKSVIPDVYEPIYQNTTNYNRRFIGNK